MPDPKDIQADDHSEDVPREADHEPTEPNEPSQEDRPTGSRPFSQDDVNRLVQTRLARLRSKMIEPDEHDAVVHQRDRLQQDVDRLQAELDHRQAQLQAQQRHWELVSQAQRLGAVDPRQVARLVEADTPATDAPAEVVSRFLSDNPHLVRPAARAGSGARRSDEGESRFSRQAIGRMSPEEFRRHEGRILEAARRGDIV